MLKDLGIQTVYKISLSSPLSQYTYVVYIPYLCNC
jgi:hypothetical protein